MIVGVMPGKFLPPHRGHLTSILKAHTQCDILYVAISEQPEHDALLCSKAGCPYISGLLRKKWLSQELQNIDGIKVVLIDESNIPLWPTGLKEYRALVDAAIPEKLDVIFHGDPVYNDVTSFPDLKHIMIDPNRGRWPISGTEIRQDPFKHWDYIIGAARPFFAKKVLITGTESCGKTTITKKLAKIYYTSWSEELGRHYANNYLGGDESVFTPDDFMRIGHLQLEQDIAALKTANRVCFFDTDAVVTEFYSKIYLKKKVDLGSYVDPNKYDLILFMAPDVKWVQDGTRFLGEETTRWALKDELYNDYLSEGFDAKKINIISGNYEERLSKVMELIDGLIS